MKRIFSQINKKYLLFYSAVIVLFLLSACTRQSSEEAQPTSAPIEASQIPTATESILDVSSQLQDFRNELSGLSFQFPSDWYGPDVVEWEDGVRVSIGSDVVYPYGTSREEQISTVENSYYVVIQLENKNAAPLNDIYESVLALQDGESIESTRSLTTRMRSLRVGNLVGIEYIATLSETAQTEFFYSRAVLLYDQDTHFITITGSPNNVSVATPDKWREAYQAVDEEYLHDFYAILESITIN